jgi:hypothetical protein
MKRGENLDKHTTNQITLSEQVTAHDDSDRNRKNSSLRVRWSGGNGLSFLGANRDDTQIFDATNTPNTGQQSDFMPVTDRTGPSLHMNQVM